MSSAASGANWNRSRRRRIFSVISSKAAYLTLTSNVVAAAIQEASLRAQIAATQEIITAETQQLKVLQRQFNLGGASRAAVLAQQATLSATQATLPNLEKQLAQQRILLTALAGRFPSQEVGQTFDLAALQLPQELPVSLPSKLVEQRPDVQASQAQLHQASAQVGVAIANMLPQITLSASYGNTVTDIGKLLDGPGIWSLGAGLVQPIFKGGQLLHEKRAAEAAYQAAAAQYRGTVITAFQNVADALRALQSDAAALAAQLAAERSAADNLAISRRQYQDGAINYSTLLNAETTYQQAHINRVVAQATRFSDTAALFQALGGGWWNRTDLADESAGTRRHEALDMRIRNDQAHDHHAGRGRDRARPHLRLRRDSCGPISSSNSSRRLANPPQTVSTIVARVEPWQKQLQAVGSLRAARGADLSSQVAGTVAAVHFESGVDVAEGTLLVELSRPGRHRQARRA